jgi:hypothetical protein
VTYACFPLDKIPRALELFSACFRFHLQLSVESPRFDAVGRMEVTAGFELHYSYDPNPSSHM